MPISDKCLEGKKKQYKEILAVWCLSRLTRESFSEEVILKTLSEGASHLTINRGQCPKQRKQMHELWEVRVPAWEQQ